MDKSGASPVSSMEHWTEARGLEQRHEELERRLAELDRHLSLTPDEQVERSRLKKQKLLVKDRLQQLRTV